MNKLANIAPVAILMVIISITLAPLSAHGGGIGYHCLKMAKSLAMFCAGGWFSEFLRNRLSRKHLITIGIIGGMCIIQYWIIEILFIYLEGDAYLWRTPAMIGKFVYFLAFFGLGLIMNTSYNRTSVETSNAEVIIYPFRQNIVNRTGLNNNGRLLKDCISAVICLGLYLTMKRLPENIQFYYSTSEGLRLALRTLAIIPWFATLIFVYKVCMSDLLMNLSRRLSKLSLYIASMLPAAILIMVPMQTYSPFYWWQDLIIYLILLILLSIAIRFVTQLCKSLFSKTFEWKYIFLGYK